MNKSNRKGMNQVLKQFCQLEHMTEAQYKILKFLRTQQTPTLPKTISERLGIGYNSTRARLSELANAGYVIQPNKQTIFIGSLPLDGKAKHLPGGKVCGYSAV